MDESQVPPGQQAHRRSSLRLVLLGVFTAFVLGMVFAFLLLRGTDWRFSDLFAEREAEAPVATMPLGQTAAPAIAPPATPATVAETVERVEQVEQQAGGIDQRVAAMEQRLARLDLQAQAAAGNAARAEGMLIVFATRRAIERGQSLGYLEDQLRLRFGEARPNAVQTVIDAAADPVLLDQLLVQLDTLAPDLTEVPESEGLLGRIGYEFSRLFSVRTADTPSPIAEQRLDRARRYIENGWVERAIVEVRAMPNTALAAEWLAEAQRYAAAQRALEALEAASIADPRDLRDAEGRRVEQRSPAE